MAKVIGVRFKSAGKMYYFDPKDFAVSLGSHVIVETARGIECGTVTMAPREIPDEEVIHPLKPVVRAATKDDIARMERNRSKEKDAFSVCEKKIAEHGLDMKLVDAEYTFDGTKILFYFIADGRIDFRELVKDLASVFKMRIELRQIGVRDESRMMGGLGICGRPFCCSSFMGDFHPVSIKMAKDQGLSLNPTKISGCCGRLMCCLKFEQNAYEDLLTITPRVGAKVKTPDGEGKVVDANVITGNLRVALFDTPDIPKTYHRSVLKVLPKNPPQNQPREKQEKQK